MAEWRASGWRERVHHFVRREAPRREPPRRVGEGSGRGTDDDRDQDQRSKRGTGGRPVRRGHSNLTVTVDRSSVNLTIPVRLDQPATGRCSLLSGSSRIIDRNGLIRRYAFGWRLESVTSPYRP